MSLETTLHFQDGSILRSQTSSILLSFSECKKKRTILELYKSHTKSLYRSNSTKLTTQSLTMNRLSSPVSMIALACRRSIPSLRAGTALPTTTATRPYSNSNSGKTSSAPKSAEEPSATSGGSRSKEAVETGSSPTAGPIPDQLAEGDARGKTGGGAPLESSRDAPSPPKVNNAAVHGGKANLSKEQQAEVDEHNRDFENKHGKAEPAADDRVDKSFWSGKGSRFNKQ